MNRRPRTLLATLMAGIAFASVLRAQDFDADPILPIVPELSEQATPKAAPKAPAPAQSMETIEFPSFPQASSAPPIQVESEVPDTMMMPEPLVPQVVSPPSPVLPSIQMPEQLSASEKQAPVEASAPVNPPVPQMAAPEVPDLAAQELQTQQAIPSQADANNADTQELQAAPAAESLPDPSAGAQSPQADEAAPNGQPVTVLSDTKVAASSVQPQISLGEFEFSLMFAPEDMATLRQVLMAYEVRKNTQTAQSGDEGEGADADLLAELLRNAQGDEALAPDAQAAPAALPDFYLGTIVFNHKGDWSVWINQQQLNPKKRTTADSQISVRAVGSGYATLVWKPENVIAAKMRWDEAKDSKLDGAKAWRHREVRGARIDYDDEKNEFIIVMRANQTFSADTMQLLEGRKITNKRTASANAPAISGGATSDAAAQTLGLFDPAANGAGAIPTLPTDSQGSSLERGAANRLINNLNTATGAISGIAGGGNEPNAPSNPAPVQ